MSAANFALYYTGDAYSTDAKIMGRQSAGKALMKGIARRWPTEPLHGFGVGRASGEAMVRQLRRDGRTAPIRWREAPGDEVLDSLGAVYCPAPIPTEMAYARNMRGPTGYSLFGVTHTLSSVSAFHHIAAAAQAPFRPWDALICTSGVARSVVGKIQDETRAWLAEQLGATRFSDMQTPVIPLGVNTPDFARDDPQIAKARVKLGLAVDDVAFLSAGRLTFHAKANPIPLYLALEAASKKAGAPLVCIEAGLYPNPRTAAAYKSHRSTVAPSVRFIEVAGDDEAMYAAAWRAADVFVSISDNIQETFGLTPVEAMAAGLPVLVSDWNGYKDTVRDGVDGYRVPTILPREGVGEQMGLNHASGADTYDFFIGRVSMATSVDVEVLAERIISLASRPELRHALGSAGQARATAEYDWPTILDRYVDLVAELGDIRAAARAETGGPSQWPGRPDPFALFADYPTHRLSGDWRVAATGDSAALAALLDLTMANYVLDASFPAEAIQEIHRLAEREEQTVDALLASVDRPYPTKVRALMWLSKFGLLALRR